jgi:polyribonucleotide nucleotidyltransferase
MEFVSPEGLRLDGRRPKELRQLKAELGVLQSADGSATFEMGNTKVVSMRAHATSFLYAFSFHQHLIIAFLLNHRF